MYEKGDLIIYGNQSVCRIENIGVISIGKQPNSRKYYTLNPIFMDGKTYVPIDTQVYNASFDFDRGVRTIIDQTS